MEADANMTDMDTLIFNGIDATTGGYLLPEMTPAEVSALAQGQTLDPKEIDELRVRSDSMKSGHYGVEADARDLSETGWGVVFAHDADPAIQDALAPLLRLRQGQAGERFKVFAGEDGYLPGESKNDFLVRYGMGPGPANPDKVPYYLLIAGDPSTIPYSFQYQLDVQYAVGRIHFDKIEDYAVYAESVVQAESGMSLPPRATFFGVANEDDRATQMSVEHLVQPLAEKIAVETVGWVEKSKGAIPQWQVETILKEQATKSSLASLLGNGGAPALLFSASHGIAFPKEDPRQLPHQGALITQDWPGPQMWRKPIDQDFYFSAEDLSQDDNLLGTIAFFFACYGAGTPQVDEFAHQIWKDKPERRDVAPHDFVASLPRRMLSLPKGGALAVVGHVERAWGVSFYWGNAGPQLQVFQDSFSRLMKGNYPIGYALEVFNNRYAELSSDLSMELDKVRNFGLKPDDRKLAQNWTANNDARNYVIIGDPAVRLQVSGANGDQLKRMAIPEISLPVKTEVAAQTIAPTPDAIAEAAQVSSGEIDYGLIDNFKQVQANMGASLQQFVSRLGDFLGKALDEASSLEVSTYVSDEMDDVHYESGRFTNARLRALTRIQIDGDTLICIPQEDGEVDTELWEIHMDMVRQAQESRAELLKTVVSAATGLVDMIKPSG